MQISKISQVFDEPLLSDIGSIEKQEAFVHCIIDDIYVNAGKNMDSTRIERDSFVKRFVRRFSYYTIGDIKYFGDCVIDGEYEIRYLSPTEIFSAWRKYVECRGYSQYVQELKKSITKDKEEYAPQDFVNGVVNKVAKTLKESVHWWDEWLNLHRNDYDNMSSEERRKSYEEYRQQKIAEQEKQCL